MEHMIIQVPWQGSHRDIPVTVHAAPPGTSLEEDPPIPPGGMAIVIFVQARGFELARAILESYREHVAEHRGITNGEELGETVYAVHNLAGGSRDDTQVLVECWETMEAAKPALADMTWVVYQLGRM